jgi:dTDP-4-dehydrorhamnose reductase
MNKALITGATGLLGMSLVSHLKNVGHSVVTHARTGGADFLVDLADSDKSFDMLSRIKPDLIINLVSLTNVELCQDKPNLAYLGNTRSVENLTNWILQTGANCHLIQISTDHLYDGNGLQSEDQIQLTNNYAFSKYAGEMAATRVPSTILRTNFFGRSKAPHRESITDWVFSSLKLGKSIQVFDDIFFSPLSMVTLAEMINLVWERKPIGTFNLGSHDGMSKADFNYYFSDCLGLPTHNMTRIKSHETIFLKTYRPKDMRMNCAKFENMLQVQLPSLMDEIKLLAGEYHD